SLLISIPSFAQDLNAEENKYLGYIYQQQEYQLVDSKGDILLLWTANQIPKYIVKSLTGKAGEHLKERERKVEELLVKYPEYRLQEEKKNVIIKDYIDYNQEHEPFE